MRHLLQNLYTAQLALSEATSADEVTGALREILRTLFSDATIDVTADISATDTLTTLAKKAIQTRTPQTNDDSNQIAIPLIADDQVRGMVKIGTKTPLSLPELAAALSLSQIAAMTLDELSWRAKARVLHQLVENANVAIDVANLGGEITYANSAAAKLYGFKSPDDLIGTNAKNLYYSDEENRAVTELILHAEKPEGWRGEVTQKHQDGTPFPVDLAVFGLRDPFKKLASFGAIAQDSSERQQLLISLKAQASQLAALNRIGTILSSSLDRNYILSVAARYIVELLKVDHCGIAIIDEYGENAEIAAEYPSTLLSRYTIPLEGNPIFNTHATEDFFISPDIEADPRLDPVRTVLQKMGVRAVLIVRLVVSGKLLGSIGIDVLDHPRTFTEDEIEACRTLAHQIALAVENADLYTQAVSANRLKSQFLATISHELRTPLNAILGYTELALSGSYGSLGEKQRDRLERVLINAQQLLTMIDDVLDFSKIEAGQIRLMPEVIDVVPLVRGTLASVVSQIQAKNLALDISIADHLPRAYADGGRLQQMLLNLLSNALKFTHQGSISVRCFPLKTASEAATLKADGAAKKRTTMAIPIGDWVAVSVQDTGIGIARENYAIIFDAFRQVDGSSIRQYSGTGLGLAITKKLAALQGGDLWVESEIGRGSVFTFVLPVAKLPTI